MTLMSIHHRLISIGKTRYRRLHIRSCGIFLFCVTVLGMMTGTVASEPSVCASQPIQLKAWSVHVLSAAVSGSMEGRSSTWFASTGSGLNATSPKGTVVTFR